MVWPYQLLQSIDYFFVHMHILDGSVYSLLLLPVLLVAPDSINPFSELFEFVDVRLDQEHTVMCTKLKIC